MSRQLALKVGLPDLASFDNFHSGSNAEAVQSLRSLAARRPGLLFLHGGAGSGKSHLLYAAVKQAEALKRPVFYVSRAATAPDDTDWLDLPGDGLTCIDDIGESVSPAQAAALFSLYERVRAGAGSLVLCSRWPPATIAWVLPDLRSRVRADLVYHLSALDDAGLAQALRLRAGQRGLHLSDEVMRFVLSRYERSPASLFRLLDLIDVESLAQKRRVTVPFLRALESELRISR